MQNDAEGAWTPGILSPGRRDGTTARSARTLGWAETESDPGFFYVLCQTRVAKRSARGVCPTVSLIYGIA